MEEKPQSPGVPTWLLQPEMYSPPHDRERFLRANRRKLAGILSNLKLQRGGLGSDCLASPLDRLLARVNPAFRLLGLIATIVCVSISGNMLFAWTAFAVFLVMLALKPAALIVDILEPCFAACLFTALIMLPAAFFGQSSALVRVTLKVLISVGLVLQLSRGVAHNEFVAGLAAYHIPGIVIFILDMALKYIVLLGDVASGALEALMLRSVGRNDDKSGASSGIMGVTFLKAHDYADEMYEAMECRGFTGEYAVAARRRFSGADGTYLALIVLEVLFLLFTEGVFL